MTPERREQIKALLHNTGTGYAWIRSAWSAIEELLAEVDRLNAELKRALRIIEVADDGCSCMAAFAAHAVVRNEEAAAATTESDGAR